MDWKIWLYTGILVFNGVMFCVIKFNDLKHLTKDVDELKSENKEHKTLIEKKLDRIFTRLGKIDRAIVRRDAICEERHKE